MVDYIAESMRVDWVGCAVCVQPGCDTQDGLRLTMLGTSI